MSKTQLSLAEAAHVAGHQPLTERTWFRCTSAFKDRIEAAAQECEMTASDWMRSVIEGSLEVHEAKIRAIVSGVDYDHLDPEIPQEPEEESPRPTDPDYAERVREDAQRAREEHRKARAPAPPRPSPRECIHPPQRRQGPRCGVCGTIIGQVRTGASGGGRYTGGWR